MRSLAFTLACFLILVLLIIGFSISASAVQTNWPAYRAPSKSETAVERKAELRGNRLVDLTRPRGHTNQVWRESRSFPLMFSRPAKNRKRSAP